MKMKKLQRVNEMRQVRQKCANAPKESDVITSELDKDGLPVRIWPPRQQKPFTS